MSSKYDVAMMDTAWIWSKFATCSRMAVGCVVARDSRILVQGYNGSPTGMAHCDHRCDCSRATPCMENVGMPHDAKCATGPDNCKAVHAEQNAIAWAARVGARLEGATLYSTHQPCLVCARLIVTTGILRVCYEKPYRLSEGLDLLQEAGLEVWQYEPEIDFNNYPTSSLSPCLAGWRHDDDDHAHQCTVGSLRHITHVCACGQTKYAGKD